MERLLTMLNHGLVSKDLREFARFKNILQEIIIKHEFLRETIRTWRARMLGEPTAPQPEPEPRRSEAGPAAPPPQVKHVAWSSSAPAAPPTTTDSAYWEQVREQEAAWEDEMSGLLKIVKEEQPADLRDPMRAVSACREKRSRPHRTWSSWYVMGSQLRPPWSGWRERPTGSTTSLSRARPRTDRLSTRGSLTERDILWAVATIRRGDGQKADAAASFSASFRTRSNPLPASWGSSGIATVASASITTTRTSRTPTPHALAVRISRRRFNAPSSCMSLFGTDSATRGCGC